MSDEKPQEEQQKPKIIIDEDWKAQAQAEKDRLAQREASAPPRPQPAPGQPPRQAGTRGIPPANFATLVTGMVTQVFFYLGAIADPQTGQRFRHLGMAKHNIDLLALLEAKTKGNLSEDEKRLLDNALYETRMAYVRVAQGSG